MNVVQMRIDRLNAGEAVKYSEGGRVNGWTHRVFGKVIKVHEK